MMPWHYAAGVELSYSVISASLSIFVSCFALPAERYSHFQMSSGVSTHEEYASTNGLEPGSPTALRLVHTADSLSKICESKRTDLEF